MQIRFASASGAIPNAVICDRSVLLRRLSRFSLSWRKRLLFVGALDEPEVRFSVLLGALAHVEQRQIVLAGCDECARQFGADS